MTPPNEFSDLTQLFAAEDEMLELSGDQFTADVMQHVTVRDTKRRWVLALAGLAGGILAGAQVPDLIANMAGFELSFSHVFDTAKAELSQSAETATPVWWAIAAVVGMSVLAVFQMERA